MSILEKTVGVFLLLFKGIASEEFNLIKRAQWAAFPLGSLCSMLNDLSFSGKAPPRYSSLA